MADQEIFKFFPEPVFKYKLENFKNLNKELSEFIYKLHDKDCFIVLSTFKADCLFLIDLSIFISFRSNFKNNSTLSKYNIYLYTLISSLPYL